jgi:hypothetical protein
VTQDKHTTLHKHTGYLVISCRKILDKVANEKWNGIAQIRTTAFYLYGRSGKTRLELPQVLRMRPWNCASIASSCGDNLMYEGTCIPVAVIEICSGASESAAVDAWLACGCNVF